MPTVQTELAAPISQVAKADRVAIRTCQTWEKLEQFREIWNNLLQANPSCSIFQTPEWLAAWWQAFGSNRTLLCLLFTNCDGNIVGLAPLYADRTRFLGWPLTTLRMVGAGSGDSDGLDFIIAPGYERLCAEAFCS